jgi:transcription termination/antitermination protein NusG
VNSACDTASPNWFALTCKHQYERVSAEALSSFGFETLVPLIETPRSWSDRKKILQLPAFPRYVFCRFEYRTKTTVLRAPGITSVVSFGGQPLPVPNETIASLRTVISSGLPVNASDALAIGEEVRVTSGPLKGLTGVLVRESSSGLKVGVNVDLLQRSILVQVDRDALVPITPAAFAQRGSQSVGGRNAPRDVCVLCP